MPSNLSRQENLWGSVPQPRPVSVESLWGEVVGPCWAEPISTLVRSQVGRPGERRRGSRLGGGLAHGTAESEARAVHRADSQVLSADVARRPGLGCWMGRGTGARVTAGSGPVPTPSPTSEGGGFVCLADFGTRVRGCLCSGLRPEPGRGAGRRSEPQ